MSPYVVILANLLTLAFAAGGAWFALKQSQKDVNGLGRKMGESITTANQRYLRTCLALMTVCPAEERAKLAEMLRE